MSTATKPKVSKTQLVLSNGHITLDQVTHLQNTGLTDLQIANMIKKDLTYEKMLKQVKDKVEGNQAREYLKNRFGKGKVVLDRSLPKLDKKQMKDWSMSNPYQELTLTFPLVPSVNHMYQTGPTGIRMMMDTAKVLFLKTQDYIDSEIIKQDWQPLYKTLVVADMWFYYPDNLRRDSHNMFKFLFDTMNGIILDDDRNILPRVQDIIVDPNTTPRIDVHMYIKV